MVFDPYGAAFCLLLIGLVFGRIVRRSKYMTLVDYFKSRYNAPAATVAGFIMAIAEMGWTGVLLVVFGSIIQFFTGIPLAWGIGVSTLGRPFDLQNQSADVEGAGASNDRFCPSSLAGRHPLSVLAGQ